MSARPDAEITDVQTTRVDGNFRWTLVGVYTDAGVAGTGEGDWWGDPVGERVIEDGRPRVSDGPGLGVTLDRDAVVDRLAAGETTFDPVEE